MFSRTATVLLNELDEFRASLALGFTMGALLVFITGKANYIGYYYNLPNEVVGPSLAYIILAFAAMVGFIEFGLVRGKRGKVTGISGGFLATSPFLFIILWYSARLALYS